MLNCPDEYLFEIGDTVYLDWAITDSFPSNEPGTLKITWCSGETVFAVYGTNHEWVIPWNSICCDTIKFNLSVRDSFCNWNVDSCYVLKTIGGTVYLDTFLCLGDTLTLCCTTYTSPLPNTISPGKHSYTIDENLSKNVMDYTDSCCFDFIPLTPGEDLICHTVFNPEVGCDYE